MRSFLRNPRFFLVAMCCSGAIWLAADLAPDWGFFGHRRINRLAVFTLPPDMMVFFRHHIEYLTEHAVDPDKRRYATRHEAVRHYIDIDHWGVYPFDNVPRDWAEALFKYAEIQVISGPDTVSLWVDTVVTDRVSEGALLLSAPGTGHAFTLDKKRYRAFWYRNLVPNYYEDEWLLPCDSMASLLGVWPFACEQIRVVDHFSGYGILPYYLLQHQRRMTEAFRRGDARAILRLTAEMGHYIGDAHVPLHTTENYNGQLTDQVGIHAFWESRTPELFADTEYDYFVGKAEYIRNPQTYFWDMVLASHALVDSVLQVEKRLSQTYPSDQQYCFDERLGLTVRTQCREYTRAYQDALNGMIEERMRASILAIGSVWYTAWVDAGQPNLTALLDKAPTADELLEYQQLDIQVQSGKQRGRAHEN